MPAFPAQILLIGINPYILLPEEILQAIFTSAKKNKGPIPVKGTIDGRPFTQTLVKYAGSWRLYLNNEMRVSCGKEVGDTAIFTLQFDKKERVTPMHPALEAALQKNKAAAKIFEGLAPYLQKEIMRYINGLKTPASVDKNIDRAINFLLGKERFIGRNHP